MKNIEREEELIASQAEIADKEGTYEQKVRGDLGNKTVYTGNANVFVQKKTQKKKEENIVFTD